MAPLINNGISNMTTSLTLMSLYSHCQPLFGPSKGTCSIHTSCQRHSALVCPIPPIGYQGTQEKNVDSPCFSPLLMHVGILCLSSILIFLPKSSGWADASTSEPESSPYYKKCKLYILHSGPQPKQSCHKKMQKYHRLVHTAGFFNR